MDQALQMVGQHFNTPLTIPLEDRQRVAMVEACNCLRQGSPGRALEVLEEMLAYAPKRPQDDLPLSIPVQPPKPSSWQAQRTPYEFYEH